MASSDPITATTQSPPSDPPSDKQPLPLLSIVAEPPPSTGGPLSNTFIDSVLDRLSNSSANRGPNQLGRAYSIAKLHRVADEFLRATPGEVDLQVVGHGMAGFLGLGESWSGRYLTSSDFQALDSNPGLLVNLADFRGRFRTVTLAACNIADVTSRVRPVGGTTLLFALQELWGCPVFGAMGQIDFSNFDAVTGAYKGPKRLWNGDGLGELGPSEAARAPVQNIARMASGAVAHEGPEVTFHELMISSALSSAYAQPAPRAVSPELNHMIATTYRHPRTTGPGLATPEFAFTVRTADADGAVDGAAWISLDGQYLTVQFGEDLPEQVRHLYSREGQRYYQHYAADGARLDELVRALFGDLRQQPVAAAA